MFPTGLTTAADSVFGQVLWTTVSEYGSREIIEHEEDVNLLEFLRATELVDIQAGADIVDVYASIEAGANTANINAGEFEEPDAYVPGKGYETRIYPERYINRYVLSSKEILQAAKGGGEQIARASALVDKKHTGSLNNIFAKVKKEFVTEILNKFADAAGSYNCPDTRPVLDATHTFANGLTFDNTIAAAGTAYGETVLDAVRAYEAGFKDSAGEDYTVLFDTVIVAQGSANEKAAWKIHEQDGVVPTRYQDVNIYEGDMRVVSIRGMKSDMILFTDSRMDKIIKFHYTDAIAGASPVPASNNAVSVTYEGWGSFGVVDIPLGIAGVAGV